MRNKNNYERIDRLIKNICNGNLYGNFAHYTDEEINYFFNTYSDLQMSKGKYIRVAFSKNKLNLIAV